MCSVVIVRFGDIVCVTMNRDEFRARVPELPPARWSSGLIAPRDGLGQGTWIGVMPDGAWACLLNSYEPVNVSARRPSRGLLVPTILAANDPEQLLHNLDLSVRWMPRFIIGTAKRSSAGRFPPCLTSSARLCGRLNAFWQNARLRSRCGNRRTCPMTAWGVPCFIYGRNLNHQRPAY